MFKNYFNQRKEKSFHWSVMHTWWRQEKLWPLWPWNKSCLIVQFYDQCAKVVKKKFLCLFENCARNISKRNVTNRSSSFVMNIYIFKAAFWFFNVFNIYRSTIDIELLKTRVLPHIRTEHMPHAPRYRMTNGLKREFAVLY